MTLLHIDQLAVAFKMTVPTEVLMIIAGLTFYYQHPRPPPPHTHTMEHGPLERFTSETNGYT